MRFVKALVLCAALAVSGCSSTWSGFKWNESVLSGGASLTATIANPVTIEKEAAAEAVYNLGATAIVTYDRLPRCGAGKVFTATNPCSSWPVVQKLGRLNRVAYAQLVNLRKFMDTNDQISAITAFNALIAAMRELRATAYINGVVIPEK